MRPEPLPCSTDNPSQSALWNGPSGHAWIAQQAVLDALFEPFQTLLVDAAVACRPSRVLDVGCGTGGTTLALATRLGTATACTGIDLSAPMIDLARARARRAGVPVTFLCADAQVHDAQDGPFDLIVSRFGVMFFSDPVQAFARLRRAARKGATLCFLAWRSAAENPFMTTAERAAVAWLPDLPPRHPDAPGQFAFADAQRVAGILRESGWADVDIQPIDVPCTLPEQDLVGYLTHLGPVGLALQGQAGTARPAIIEHIRQAFAPYVQGTEIRVDAACWWVTARAAG